VLPDAAPATACTLTTPLVAVICLLGAAWLPLKQPLRPKASCMAVLCTAVAAAAAAAPPQSGLFTGQLVIKYDQILNAS
jgi:hypothetical protein